MDRNQVTGLLLIFLMLMLYFQYFALEPVNNEQTKKTQQKTLKEAEKKADLLSKSKEEQEELKDSTRLVKNFGSFSKAMQGKPEDIVLENQDLKITFSTQGGKIKEVLLKKYLTYQKKPLVLLDEKSSLMTLNIQASEGRKVDIYRLFYEASDKEVKVASSKSGKISFIAKLAPDKYIQQTYSLSDKGFELGYDLKFSGMDNFIKEKSKATFYWLDKLKRVEFDMEQDRYYTTVNYYTSEGNFNYLTWPSPEKEEIELKEKIHWFAFKQKFFTSALVAKNENLLSATFSQETDVPNTQFVKTLQGELSLSSEAIKAGDANFMFYFGPNRYYILNDVPVEGFYQNVYLGWPIVRIFTRYLVIPIFALLEGVVSNYGIIIILLVLIIKVMILPLAYKSYISMAKMKVMKPELDAIKEKHGGDMQKAQADQMELYRQVGINPLSGCLPLLLQMPVILAMFTFFPNAIELRQQSFLWANDLSVYDSIATLPFAIPFYGSHVSLFTILMTLSTLWVTYVTNQNAVNLEGPMKYMGYIMPVVFMFVLNTFPAGLSFYYLVQNVFSVGQQELIRRFVDDAKIRAVLEQNKLKNKDKKKSKWRLRLEEAYQKAQQETETKTKEKAKTQTKGQQNKKTTKK